MSERETMSELRVFECKCGQGHYGIEELDWDCPNWENRPATIADAEEFIERAREGTE